MPGFLENPRTRQLIGRRPGPPGSGELRPDRAWFSDVRKFRTRPLNLLLHTPPPHPAPTPTYFIRNGTRVSRLGRSLVLGASIRCGGFVGRDWCWFTPPSGCGGFVSLCLVRVWCWLWPPRGCGGFVRLFLFGSRLILASAAPWMRWLRRS